MTIFLKKIALIAHRLQAGQMLQKLQELSKLQSPLQCAVRTFFTNCQRILDHIGESDCWSRRWKLSRLWFMWHLSQTTGNRWNGNGYFAPTSLLLTFSSFQHMVIVNYEWQNKTKFFSAPWSVKREQSHQHHFNWSKWREARLYCQSWNRQCVLMEITMRIHLLQIFIMISTMSLQLDL